MGKMVHVFPFKRSGEDPARMFAGEGGPERTNKRFHYVSAGQPAKRLSTAFDSVTLYGEDPDHRPTDGDARAALEKLLSKMMVSRSRKRRSFNRDPEGSASRRC